MDYKEYYYMSDLTDNELKRLLPIPKLIGYMHRRKKHYYISFPGTFDIESSTVENPDIEDISKYKGKDKYIGFMYHWQFALPIDYTNHKFLCICGRRWEEFVHLLDIIAYEYNLYSNKRLVIYVHALFFEFQFIRNFLDIEDVFARHERVPLKFTANNAFEFRCSYSLSNMSLAKFITNTPDAIYNKLSGDDFDYTKIRTPETPLTDYEIEYCLNDVRGLQEAVHHLLIEDDLHTIPLTSTGYIRREVRSAVLANPENQKNMLRMKLNEELYAACHEAFRGGNSNSNAYLANQILENVGSFDRKSSYPAEMLVDLFPVSPFISARPTVENLESYKDYAALMQVVFFDINLTNRMTIPYIPISKCNHVEGDRYDGTLVVSNGRIVKAKSISMFITDVDWKIINTHYTFKPVIVSLWFAEYGHLNNELRLNLRDAFVQKTKLELGDPYVYMKFKNKINSYFGMFVTDICSPDIFYNGEWSKEKNFDVQAKLQKYYNNKKSFLSYQQGVWITANARYRHQQGIDACGNDIVMGDTDSCKFIGEHFSDFKRLNEEWLNLCYNNDISPIVKVWEKPTVMGIWEQEKTCLEYVTLGAKKHAYLKEGKKGGLEYGVTVAGLNKNKGADWIKDSGGLDSFQIGQTIPVEYAGRTVSYYNDCDKPYYMTVDGCTFLNGSNIGVVQTTYTIGVSDDYLSYLIGISEERASYNNPYTDENYSETIDEFNEIKKEFYYA